MFMILKLPFKQKLSNLALYWPFKDKNALIKAGGYLLKDVFQGYVPALGIQSSRCTGCIQIPQFAKYRYTCDKCFKIDVTQVLQLFVLYFFCNDLLRVSYFDRNAMVYCIMVCMHHFQLVLLLQSSACFHHYRQLVKGVCPKLLERYYTLQSRFGLLDHFWLNKQIWVSHKSRRHLTACSAGCYSCRSQTNELQLSEDMIIRNNACSWNGQGIASWLELSFGLQNFNNGNFLLVYVPSSKDQFGRDLLLQKKNVVSENDLNLDNPFLSE